MYMYLQKKMSKKLFFKDLFFIGILKVFDEKIRILIWIRKIQWYGSADPDPYQYVMDP